MASACALLPLAGMNPMLVGGGAATAFLALLFVLFYVTVVVPDRKAH